MKISLLSFVLFFCVRSNYSLSNKLRSTLSDILEGALKEKNILALVDASAFDYITEADALASFQMIPAYVIVCNNLNLNNTVALLNLPIFQQNNIALVLVTGKPPKWLEDDNLFWSFNTVLIYNVNSAAKSEQILASYFIQRSINIALIEPKSKNKNQLNVFTSRPFHKNLKGKRDFKLLLGNWDANHFQKFSDLFPDRFPSFNGEELQVSSDSDDFPFVATTGEGSGEFYGLCILLLDTIGSVLNFIYTTTYEADDLNWGEKINGTWNGLLKELVFRNKNLTINYFTFTYDRSQDFDFSAPYFYEGFGFALRMPVALPLWMNLIFPFLEQVWVAIIITLFFLPIFFFGILRLYGANKKVSISQTYFDTFKVSLFIFK